ncbi:MAG: baseplate J/gp47 family protein [Parvibaculum sp.]|nr:baseplate J/gp47 family protein [Parvibaculum sp.]
MADTGFTRPTLAEIVDRVQSDINSKLTGADARLRRSVLTAIGRAQAGLAHGLYGYQKNIARQAIIDACDGDSLAAWGRVFEVSKRLATKATGNATLTGTNGAVIEVGETLSRTDGVLYETTAEATISAGVATVAVRAAVSGAAGNAHAGVSLSFVSPVAGVAAASVVAAGGFTGGADDEADGDAGTDDVSTYRGRILQRLRQPPLGGSVRDYERWALEVAGVTRVWVYPLELGAGTVTVRFMMDATYADGVPESGNVSTVQDYIDDPERRPVTAEVFVVAPIAEPLDITVTGLSPNTAAVRAAVEAELADMITRTAAPGGTIPISKIWEYVALASGEESHLITIPSGNVTHSTGYIATLGTVTFA